MYTTAAELPTNIGNALGKFDVETGSYKLWSDPASIPGEPMMIPRPGAQV